MPTRAEAEIVEWFTDRYRVGRARPMVEVERQVLGVDYGSTGYTTLAQADDLGRRLGLGPGRWLADIGAGAGWPGLYLAATTGCRVVATDLPLEGLQRAQARARDDGIQSRVAFLVATGTRQPDVTPGLDDRQRRQANRAGAVQVAARQEYVDLVGRAGFTDIVEVDLTEEYATTQRAWYEATEHRAEEIRQFVSDLDFAEAQADRRATLAAIAAGLLRRSLFTAVRR